jgi:phage I-like protein
MARRLIEVAGQQNVQLFTPIALSADDLSTPGAKWVPLVIAGNWYNLKRGEVEITSDDLARMLSNFKSGLYPPPPQQLPIDYEHLSMSPNRKPGDGIAGGWIQDLEIRENGNELWALVEWTDAARDHITKKHYKGLSPVFHPNYIAHGKKEIGVTLMGGGLTNYQTIPGCLAASQDPAFVFAEFEESESSTDPVAASLLGDSIMKLKTKNGQEVELDPAALGALTLDALSEIPAVKSLRDRADASTTTATELDTLKGTVTTLSNELNTLKTKNTELQEQATAARALAIENEITGLVATGRILPKEKDHFVKLAQASPELYADMIKARKESDPLVKIGAESGAGGGGQSQNAVVMFENAVEEFRTKNPKADFATALAAVAREKPELAKARNIALSLPVGPGGVAMIQA